MDTTNSTDDLDGWPLGEIEPVILELETTIGIFHHLIHSPSQVEENEWSKLEDDLTAAARRIKQLWLAAYKQRGAENRAHAAALAAAEAERAAPGSAKDREQVETLWRILGAAVTVAARQCSAAGFPPALLSGEPAGFVDSDS